MDITCFFCGGAAHPATGSVYSETCIACWRCTDEFMQWVKRHTSSRWRAFYFYDFVVFAQRASVVIASV